MLKRYNIPFLLVIMLTIPALFGLFHKGMFVSDDGNWMIIRFSAFYEAMRHGESPVRWLPRLNNGYGYPVADFLYPLYMYLGVPFKVLGIGFVSTIKVIFMLSVLLSGVGAYLWLSIRYDKWAAMVGALCYVYFPYHLFDVYTRGSIGELLALAIVPYIFWQIEKRHLLTVICGVSLLILSHNTLALLFFPIIIGYCFGMWRSYRETIYVVLGGLSLSTFFWLPALADQQVTVFSRTPVSDISQYFITFKMLPLYGLITVLILGMTAILWKRMFTSAILVCVFLLIITTCLAFPFTAGIWYLLHLDKIIQFAFRLLSVTALCLAFLSAAAIHATPKNIRIPVICFVCLIIMYSSIAYLLPKAYQDYPDTWYSTNQDTTTVKNEYMPLWVKIIPTTMSSTVVQVIKGDGVVEHISSTGTVVTASVSMKDNGVLGINIIDFPGWRVRVDGLWQPISHDNEYGTIHIVIPQGHHVVYAFFEETPVRLISDVISLCSFLLLVALAFKIMQQSKKP